MKNGTIWNTELALNLESLFYKDSVAGEYMKMVDRLSRLWQEIAALIGFELTNEDVVNKIKELGTDDPASALYVFDNAEEAISFFQDMRTVNARKALFCIKKKSKHISNLSTSIDKALQ